MAEDPRLSAGLGLAGPAALVHRHRLPRSTSACAVDRPAIPAPTTATSVLLIVDCAKVPRAVSMQPQGDLRDAVLRAPQVGGMRLGIRRGRAEAGP